MTHLYTIFLQKAPNLEQIGCFFSLIFQNTPNFANWAHWVCEDNPPIDIPRPTKMHLKTFEHPRIPFVSENPPPVLNIVFLVTWYFFFHKEDKILICFYLFFSFQFFPLFNFYFCNLFYFGKLFYFFFCAFLLKL